MSRATAVNAERSVTGACQRCGRRVQLSQPARGDPDLDLDQAKAHFRFCGACRRYVGRSCCWSPEAVACTDCARALAVASADELEPARRALAELRISIRGMESVGIGLDSVVGAAAAEAAAASWQEAWWGVSWLVTRAESSRDAVSRRLWHRSGPSEDSALLAAELAQLLVMYQAARRGAEERLSAAARLAALVRA